jgi:DNA-binding CsgD family transcriptional regulator
MMILFCAWRDLDPSEYPPSLLDPRTCAQVLLRHLYAILPATPPIDKNLRNESIYRRYLEGETTDELAKAFDLSVQTIRGIIRRMRGRK